MMIRVFNNIKGLWRESRTILLGIGIALMLRMFLFEPFNIPSGSMYPTLHIGDFVLVSKYEYGYSRYSILTSPNLFKGRIFTDTPKRGDVAVFRNPFRTDIDYVKRVVGLPGDVVQVRKGRLYINGKRLKRKRVEDFNYRLENGRQITVPQYIETLPNGKTYRILEMAGDQGPLDNTPPFEVKRGHYFMMGDNRDNSVDSRVGHSVGQVPLENYIGPAKYVFMSFGQESRWYNPISWFTHANTGRFFIGIE